MVPVKTNTSLTDYQIKLATILPLETILHGQSSGSSPMSNLNSSLDANIFDDNQFVKKHCENIVVQKNTNNDNVGNNDDEAVMQVIPIEQKEPQQYQPTTTWLPTVNSHSIATSYPALTGNECYQSQREQQQHRNHALGVSPSIGLVKESSFISIENSLSQGRIMSSKSS